MGNAEVLKTASASLSWKQGTVWLASDYERLKKFNRLDKMKTIVGVKDYSKIRPPAHLRTTIMGALEREEKEVVTK